MYSALEGPTRMVTVEIFKDGSTSIRATTEFRSAAPSAKPVIQYDIKMTKGGSIELDLRRKRRRRWSNTGPSPSLPVTRHNRCTYPRDYLDAWLAIYVPSFLPVDLLVIHTYQHIFELIRLVPFFFHFSPRLEKKIIRLNRFWESRF